MFRLIAAPAIAVLLLSTAVARLPQTETPQRAFAPDRRDGSAPPQESDAEVRLTQFGGIAPPIFPQLFDSRAPAAPPSGVGRDDGPSAADGRLPAAENRLFTRARRTPRRRRLSRAPAMLGDTFQPPLPFVAQEAVNGANFLIVNSALFAAGGSSRMKAGEHNKALPVDRVYANYNHFHNAVRRDAAIDVGGMVTDIRQIDDVDRFILGIERTFLAGNASVELRLPLSSIPELTFNDLGGPPSGRMTTDSGRLGNLNVVGKCLLLDEGAAVVSAGLALGIPTGDDGELIINESVYRARNDSVFLQPFLAVSHDHDRTFVHSFVQVDVAANGNDITVNDTTGFNSLGTVGTITPPTLLHFDLTLGRWIVQRSTNEVLSGLAALVEFHLTTALSSADSLAGLRMTPAGDSFFGVQSVPGDFTAMYVTSGLHAELFDDWTARVAGVVPLRNGTDRLFDAEVLVQVGRRY